MLKHIDDIRKSAKERAQRRWQNYATEKAFKAARQEAANAPKEPKPIEPADVLEQERVIKEGTTKFESKFLKEIRMMLDEHKGRNLALYALSIRVRHKRLLMEKLRYSLEARESQQACTRGNTGVYCKPACPGKNRAAPLFSQIAGGATKEGSFLKDRSGAIRLSHISLMRNCIISDRVFWQGKEAENAAWKAEIERRREAKRLEQELIAKERAARLHAIKNAIPYSETIATEICERVSVGELLLDICDDENMPTMRRCNQWLKEHSDFAALFKDSINE